MQYLPEVREDEAKGEIAEIYAEMKHLGGVPMVALIFRHLATLPGALEWMWAAVAPAWRSGRLQESAWRVAREAELAPLPGISRAALRAVGVDEAGEREAADVLLAYNRANPENLLTNLLVVRLVAGRTGTPAGERSWTPPPAPGPLAPMVHPDAMTPEVRALLDLVAAPGAPGSPRVVQSLYRHFAHRPAFLALAITLLRMRFDDGSIDRATAAVHRAMSAEADAIVRTLCAPPAPHPGIEPVCTRFSGAVIPQMIVVGRLLEEAMPAAGR